MGKKRPLHEWPLEPKEAVTLQKRLRADVVTRGSVRPLRWVTGVDVAYKDGKARAAAVVCRWPGMEVLEERVAEAPVRFPYVPGLLSFREAPVALEALSHSSPPPFPCLLPGILRTLRPQAQELCGNTVARSLRIW